MSTRVSLQVPRRQVPATPLDEPTQMDIALNPLRTPATIRDTKQVFIYAQRLANLKSYYVASVNPIVFVSSGAVGDLKNALYYINWTGYGPDGSTAIPVGAPTPPNDDFYYNSYPNNARQLPEVFSTEGTTIPNVRSKAESMGTQLIWDRIGTELKIDIQAQINELFDIRVPADKVLIEISLVECQIESDASSYQQTFDQQYINQNPLDFRLNKTVPQTLYSRIKEVDNGEAYNWSTTNTGSYSNDKSHAVLVRWGQLNYGCLTLEYGHLGMGVPNASPEQLKPVSWAYANSLTWKWDDPPPAIKPDPSVPDINNVYGVPAYPGNLITGLGAQTINYDIVAVDESVDANNNLTGCRRYPDPYKYYDYNSAWFVRPPEILTTGPVPPAGEVPDPLAVGSNTGPKPAPQSNYLNRKYKPLFYNQQATNITFRLMVKYIHMF